jgi:hypothetical protein
MFRDVVRRMGFGLPRRNSTVAMFCRVSGTGFQAYGHFAAGLSVGSKPAIRVLATEPGITLRF